MVWLEGRWVWRGAARARLVEVPASSAVERPIVMYSAEARQRRLSSPCSECQLSIHGEDGPAKGALTAITLGMRRAPVRPPLDGR